MNTIGSDEILLSVTPRELDIIRNALASYGGVWSDRPDDELAPKDIEWRDQEHQIREEMILKVEGAILHEHGREQQREYELNQIRESLRHCEPKHVSY